MRFLICYAAPQGRSKQIKLELTDVKIKKESKDIRTGGRKAKKMLGLVTGNHESVVISAFNKNVNFFFGGCGNEKNIEEQDNEDQESNIEKSNQTIKILDQNKETEHLDDFQEYMREMEFLKTDFSDLVELDLEEIEEMKEAIFEVQQTETSEDEIMDIIQKSSEVEEQITDDIEETEDTKAITRSVHIVTRYAQVTITTQDKDEDIQLIRKIAEELIDKYASMV